MIYILCLLMFLAVFFATAYFLDNASAKTPVVLKTISVAELRKRNLEYAKRRAREIEIERGKILSFRRKSYYRSTRGSDDAG